MVKSKDKTNKKVNKKGLLVILLALYLLIMAFYYVWKMPIKAIIIKGNNVVTDTEIIKVAEVNTATKLLTLSQNSVEKKIMTIPMIDKVTVKKSITGELTINIVEAKVLFFNKLNNKYVLSNKNETNSITNVLGVPTLNNYVPNDKYENLINKISKIDIDIISLISEIEYDPDIKNDITIDNNRFLLRMNDGNTVYINLANFDNLNNYIKIYTTLDGKGLLNLDSNSDKVIFTSYEALKRDEENELSQ